MNCLSKKGHHVREDLAGDLVTTIDALGRRIAGKGICETCAIDAIITTVAQLAKMQDVDGTTFIRLACLAVNDVYPNIGVVASEVSPDDFLSMVLRS